ncbi:uncharacterized protein LOC134827200 [Culicoides brevitarsis]|uniref:uncharacterized protein LOC134827200 n=1 Tax=Culicoides brevitarsis TaxID=469753 RepID=UPI00307B383F
MNRGGKINAKRALEVIQQAADEVSSDSFCGFSEEEDALPAKRLRTFTYKPIQAHTEVPMSGRSSVISQYSEMGTTKIERKPTRRPDPHVNNRNAIMARENRRKHKENQERLERENAILQKENEELRAHLKAKDRQISSLRHEYKYLKSIIANKTQICEILRAVQSSRLPLTSSLENFRSDPSHTVMREMSPASVSTVSATTSGYQSPSTSENSDYEMDANALPTDPKWANDPIFSDIPATSEDVDVDHFLDFVDNPNSESTTGPIVRDEHSYSENIEDPGVCVHISNQKVSIEFCSKCHKGATNAFMDDI